MWDAPSRAYAWHSLDGISGMSHPLLDTRRILSFHLRNCPSRDTWRRTSKLPGRGKFGSPNAQGTLNKSCTFRHLEVQRLFNGPQGLGDPNFPRPGGLVVHRQVSRDGQFPERNERISGSPQAQCYQILYCICSPSLRRCILEPTCRSGSNAGPFGYGHLDGVKP